MGRSQEGKLGGGAMTEFISLQSLLVGGQDSVTSEPQKSVDLPISKEQTLFLAGNLSQQELPLGNGVLCWQNTAWISQVVWTWSQIATQLMFCANQSLCQPTFTDITKHVTISQLAFEYFHVAKISHIAKMERIKKTLPFCCS